MPAAERKLFKDWYNEDATVQLADQIGALNEDFDRKVFLELATRDLPSLEMLERVQQFSDALAGSLPPDRGEALRILRRTLPDPLPDCENVNSGWLQRPIGQFISDHGLEHFDEAWETMIELTKRFTSEFAIRPYVEAFPEKVFPLLSFLTSHQNPHVRRWCSEGIRPRLPWGRKLRALILDPTPVWPILEALRDDKEKYVQKSVANHLNDLTKDHPENVLTILENWSVEATPQRKWIIRHGLRTLIKEGHPRALALIGIVPAEGLTLSFQLKASTLTVGEALPMALRISSEASHKQSLLIDFVVHYVRKSGLTSEKVFKWRSVDLDDGETIELEKRHSFQETTIRALYPGIHRVDIQINGHRLASAAFALQSSR